MVNVGWVEERNVNRQKLGGKFSPRRRGDSDNAASEGAEFKESHVTLVFRRTEQHRVKWLRIVGEDPGSA